MPDAAAFWLRVWGWAKGERTVHRPEILDNGDKPGTFQKLLRQTWLPARHQYGLQTAEGMVTFFENYEQELEKYCKNALLPTQLRNAAVT